MTTHNDDGSIIEDVVMRCESGNYGVDIPKNVWHKLEALESGSVTFECEEGAVVEHVEEGVLDLTKGRKFKPIWQYCSYVFWPLWRKTKREEI